MPGGVLGLIFAGYAPLASQSLDPITVYFLANYRPHLSRFLENVSFAITFYLCINVFSRTEYNAVSASLLLNLINKHSLIFCDRESLHFEFLSAPKIRNLRTHSSYSFENATPLYSINPVVTMRPHPAAHPISRL